MSNKKLEAIASLAASHLQSLVNDQEEQILQAWSAAEEEAQLAETKPKFRLALAITLDLDADRMETALSFSIRRKVSCEDTIPDPNQTTLPLEAEANLKEQAARLVRLAKKAGATIEVEGLASGSTMKAGA